MDPTHRSDVSCNDAAATGQIILAVEASVNSIIDDVEITDSIKTMFESKLTPIGNTAQQKVIEQAKKLVNVDLLKIVKCLKKRSGASWYGNLS